MSHLNNTSSRRSEGHDRSDLSMATVNDRDDDLHSERDGGEGGGGNSVKERLLSKSPEELAREEEQNQIDEYCRNQYIARIKEQNCLYKPVFLLALFTALNTITYLDRGGLSSTASYIATDASIAGNSTLSQAQTGALYSVFMVGYFVFAPLMVGLGSYLSSKTIIVLGITCWCGAVFLAGVSHSYGLLMFARALTGIGEAAYAGFTVTMVDNVCPKESRTKWIGIFFATIPAGTAAGIAVDGFLVQNDYGSIVGWRFCFFVELIPMFIILALCAAMPKIYNVRPEDRGDDEIAAAKADEEHVARLKRELRRANGEEEEPEKTEEEIEAEKNGSHVPLHKAVVLLFCNANFMLLSFGYGAYTFVLGAISFFAISMLTQGKMAVSEIDASLLLGATTAILGLIGAVVGGILVDRWGGSKGWEGVYKCSLLLVLCMVISVPCGFILLSVSNFLVFTIIFVFSVWWLFLITAPINTSLLTVVPPNLRPYSVALSVLILHLAGDFPSTPLTGAIADAYDDGCKDFDDDKFKCESHNTTVGWCRFIPKPSPKENSRCVNTEELTIAIRFAWCVMILAIPLWGAVAYRVKKHKNVFGHPIEHHHHQEEVTEAEKS